MTEVVWQFLTGGFLVTLLGIVAYLLKRYVDRSDKRHDSMKGDVKAIKEDFEDHQQNLKNQTHKMSETATRFQQDGLAFQQGLSKEMFKFKDQIMDISTSMNKLDTAIDEVSDKVFKIDSHVDELTQRMDAHHKSLSLGAQAFAGQRDRMDKVENDMKTVTKVISDNLVMIKSVKVKKDSE